MILTVIPVILFIFVILIPVAIFNALVHFLTELICISSDRAITVVVLTVFIGLLGAYLLDLDYHFKIESKVIEVISYLMDFLGA